MNRLIYAASEQNADIFYATGFSAPDPFLYFEKSGRRCIVLSQLEYDRGRREAHVDEVINWSDFIKQIQKHRSAGVATSDWIIALLRQYRIDRVQVSRVFPIGLADAMRKRGIRLFVAKNGLFPERAFKKRVELEAIRKSLKVTSELLKGAIEMLRSSRPNKRGFLMFRGAPLTSERVQAMIRMEAAKRGFEASHPIVAGGIQGCDPHERGHGKLKVNELIILDIFPRDLKTGYWGDMTRTVVKGRATEAQRRQFEVVRQAQKLAMSKLHHGVDGKSIHRLVENFFKSRSYETGNKTGRYEGFFHGTGHGLGLELHENLGIGSSSCKLKSGNVVTVEPGLYYSKVGGVRIEDVVVIRAKECELLSCFPVRLEI